MLSTLLGITVIFSAGHFVYRATSALVLSEITVICAAFFTGCLRYNHAVSFLAKPVFRSIKRQSCMVSNTFFLGISLAKKYTSPVICAIAFLFVRNVACSMFNTFDQYPSLK